MMQKNLKHYWNPGKWVLIWEYSARAFQWIPASQGSDVFQNPLLPCALDESRLSIGRVKIRKIMKSFRSSNSHNEQERQLSILCRWGYDKNRTHLLHFELGFVCVTWYLLSGWLLITTIKSWDESRHHPVHTWHSANSSPSAHHY